MKLTKINYILFQRSSPPLIFLFIFAILNFPAETTIFSQNIPFPHLQEIFQLHYGVDCIIPG